MKQKLFLSLLALAICAGVFLAVRSKFRAHEVGSTDRIAPDFTLSGLSGSPVTLSSYRGKVVLLDFWATWCDPCRDEIPRFIALQDKYRDRGLQIIGVSMDDTPEPVPAHEGVRALAAALAVRESATAHRPVTLLDIPAPVPALEVAA